MSEARKLEAAIASLETQRATLGDAMVELAIGPLHERLASLGESSAPPEIRLRQVTVLFADIANSTAISERMDDEDVVTLMTGALARFGAVVEAHRGRVLRFMGDGLKAVFGADDESEDAPEAAIRAGLAILDEARQYAVEVARSRGIPDFVVRVGINTGEAALGGGVEDDNTAMGTTVNVAARMEQSAPPGALRISHATYVHVRGVFDVVEQPPLTVKGHGEPVVTYLVLRAKARVFRVASRGIEGVETRMIGRDAELLQLQRAFADVVAHRKLRAVTVIGDAGLGKSRLLYELQNWLEIQSLEVWMLVGRAYPHGRLQPYGLLRNILAWRLEIADSDSADVARDKLVRGMAPLIAGDGDDGIAPAELVGHLIGIEFPHSAAVAGAHGDARQIRDRAFRAAALWIRRMYESDGSPVVVLLDDLHWADEGSLDFVTYLLRNNHDMPLLAVMQARPVLLERGTQWDEGGASHTRIDIRPLDPANSREFANALLQRLGEVPAALRELVTGGGEGNPFYMEELVKMLIDDGVIVTGQGPDQSWRVLPERLVAAKVPSTLTGVLQTRLDALAPADRNALQQASVIGAVFWDQALAALDPGAPASIGTLQRKDLAQRRDPSAFDDSREYAFQHHLMHQVTYETVLKAARREGHARAATWLAARMSERTGEYLGATAEHFERAGNAPEAARYFMRAANDAAERYANHAALEYARRAIANQEPGEIEARWQMLQLRQRVFDVLGNRDEQEAALDAMDAIGCQGGPRESRAMVALCRALLADRRGEFAKAVAFAESAIEAAVPLELHAIAAKAYGDAIELAGAHGHRRLEGLLRGNLAGILIELGDFEDAREQVASSLRIAREIGNRSAEANALSTNAGVLLALGDTDAALANAREAVDITMALGDRYYGAQAEMELGAALAAAGRCDDAVAAYEKGRDGRICDAWHDRSRSGPTPS